MTEHVTTAGEKNDVMIQQNHFVKRVCVCVCVLQYTSAGMNVTMHTELQSSKEELRRGSSDTHTHTHTYTHTPTHTQTATSLFSAAESAKSYL